jgi:glycosyltransferase involved in cell wall biosynthesis
MLIEAFACGVPVIASDSGEIPFVVKDAGVVVPELDTERFAREIDELLSNNRLRVELASRGIDRVQEKYAWPVVARAHLEFFSEILSYSR